MKKLFFALFILTCNAGFAQQVKYISGNNDWDADSLGNQRVILNIKADAPGLVRSLIEWRRNDAHPENKGLILVDASTNKKINNIKIEHITRESCTIYFQRTAA